MDTRYATSKVLWHQDRVADLRAGRRPRPIMLQMVLSDLCNQDCSFCSYRASNGLSANELFPVGDVRNPNRKIPTDKALEIVGDAARLGVKSIEWTGGGEPTVHPDHAEIFQYAQKCGIEGGLITNGVKLDPEIVPIAGMTWIRVSIDAGDAETYSQVRRVSPTHWSKVWQNIDALVDGYEGSLSVSFVATPDNFHTLEHLARHCKDRGVPSLRVTGLHTNGPDPYEGHGSEMSVEVYELAARLNDKTFRLHNGLGDRIEIEQAGAPTHPLCAYQYLKVYIGADLNVYRCCHTAYTQRGLVGSLADRRLLDLREMAFEPFDARGCRTCHWRKQNDLLNDVIDEPTHSAFI